MKFDLCCKGAECVAYRCACCFAGRNQSILCERVMATFTEYKRQRIDSLWHDRHKAPTITRILTQENVYIYKPQDKVFRCS